MSFLDTIERAKAYLQRQRRVSLRAVRREFALEDDDVNAVVEELVEVQQVATLDGTTLTWAGSVEPASAGAELPGREGEATSTANAERRQLTVLFSDLVDSTRLAASMDAEDWRELVRGYQDAASAAIERFGGHVAQYLGDGLLVYFGWPRAHEDDAERAVRAALGIVGAMEHLRETTGSALAVRVGVHTGLVVVGETGGRERRETLAMGDTTNVAARLQAEAAPGTVVFSAATLRLVSGIFVTESLGECALKGAGAMHLHRALRPSGMRSRLDVSAAGGLTPLVGRDQELGLLEDRFAQVGEGLGQVVLVSGEAGIGKSRLVQAFRERVAERAHSWLECRCSPYTQDSAFYPVLELQRQALGLGADVSAATRIERLEAGLERAGFDLAQAMPIMTSFHGLPLPVRYAEPVLSPEGRRKKTLELLVEWLLRLARLQPMVFLIEDLHWVDPSTQELIGQIVERIPREPVLLLTTYRPDFEPPWGAKSHLTPMLLARLTRPQLGDLVRKAARGRDLPEVWVDEIVRRSDGVPLFAEELTRTVLESHSEPPSEGQIPELQIPDSLQDSLMARLDALGPVKELAQLGAVLGREFDYGLLRAISPMKEADLQQALAAAVREELFYQRGVPPDATYLFKHALTRDAAYHSLLRGTRQRQHQRVAETLIDRMPQLAEAQPELVAHHLTEAGDADRAIAYWQRAGERAAKRQENAESIRHFRKGLEQLEQLPSGRDRDARELVLQMAIGAPLIALKGYGHSQVEEAYQRAWELCRAIPDTPQFYLALFGLGAVYHTGRGQLLTAVEMGRQLLDRAQRSGEAVPTMLGHFGLGLSLFDQGETSEALDHLERAIELYEPSRDQTLVDTYGWDMAVLARSWAARSLWQLGHADDALRRSREAIEIGRDSPYVHSLVIALGGCAFVHHYRREPAEVRKRAEEVIAIADEQSIAAWVEIGRVIRAWALAHEGSTEGIDEIQQSLTRLAATGVALGAPYFLGLLADAQRTVDRPDDALATIGMALSLAEANDNRFWNSELLRMKGELLLRDQSTAAEGEGCLRQAMELARSKQWRLPELRVATSLARLRRDQGERTQARDLLHPVYGSFTEGFDTRDLLEAKALLEELA